MLPGRTTLSLLNDSVCINLDADKLNQASSSSELFYYAALLLSMAGLILVLVALAAFIARYKNKRKVSLWVLIGLLLNIIVLGVLLTISKLSTDSVLDYLDWIVQENCFVDSQPRQVISDFIGNYSNINGVYIEFVILALVIIPLYVKIYINYWRRKDLLSAEEIEDNLIEQ